MGTMPIYSPNPGRSRAAAEKAEYLSDLLAEAAELARKAGQPFLAYLIGMAAEEAARLARGRRT